MINGFEIGPPRTDDVHLPGRSPPPTCYCIFTGPSSPAISLRPSMKNNHAPRPNQSIRWKLYLLFESALEDLKLSWPVHLVQAIHVIDGPESKIRPLVHLKTAILKFWSFVHRDIHRHSSGRERSKENGEPRSKILEIANIDF